LSLAGEAPHQDADRSRRFVGRVTPPRPAFARLGRHGDHACPRAVRCGVGRTSVPGKVRTPSRPLKPAVRRTICARTLTQHKYRWADRRPEALQCDCLGLGTTTVIRHLGWLLRADRAQLATFTFPAARLARAANTLLRSRERLGRRRRRPPQAGPADDGCIAAAMGIEQMQSDSVGRHSVIGEHFRRPCGRSPVHGAPSFSVAAARRIGWVKSSSSGGARVDAA
jgi:hypothetical protein